MEDVPESGFFSRGPESGEVAGESVSYGIRGIGIRLPEVQLELPELRLPTVTKYRRNAEMHVDRARAPFQRGRALEFSNVGRAELGEVEPVGEPERGNVNEDGPPERGTTPDDCVPPVPPCTSSTERKLRDDLAARERQLVELNERFEHLESLVERLATDTPTAHARTSERSSTIRRLSYVDEANQVDEPELVEDMPDAAQPPSEPEVRSSHAQRPAKAPVRRLPPRATVSR